MNIKSVLTGDIVQSTKIDVAWREQLVATIRRIADDLQQLSPLQLEFFRGDSFQLVVDRPEESMKMAILLRAGLISATPADSPVQWDARISIGVGEVSYLADRVVVSDGEAFRYSGRGLDEIGKRRIVVHTKWKEANDELQVSTSFADDIVTGWTCAQAQVVYPTLLHDIAQKDLAAQCNKSAQNVSKLLTAAKEALIRQYLERYHSLLKQKLS